MSKHIHKFKVNKRESVWGLVHVQAVMRCDGMVDGNPCPARLTQVVDIDQLEKRGEKQPNYFYRNPEEKETKQWVK